MAKKKAELTTDDIEHMPHIVILRTNGRVIGMYEFKSGSEAHVFATKAAIDNAGR